MKKVLKWGIICFIGLVVIGAIFGGEDDTKSTAGDSSNGQVKETAKQEVTYKIGDDVAVGNLVYKVEGKEIKDTIGDQYFNQKAQGKYLVLQISVLNNDKEARTLDTSLFQLEDKEGVTYDPDAMADSYVNGQNMFFLDKINPKITKTGYIVFDLADPDAEYTLKVTGGMISGEEQKIVLSN